MKKLVLIALGSVLLGLVSSPAYAGSQCNNGSYSSNSGRGTCSWNGGVNKSFPSYSDPGSSSYNRNNGFSNRNNGFSNGLNSTGKNSLTGKSCRKGVSLC